MTTKNVDDVSAIYLVGGGIASLAAAAFLIRDGGVLGNRITVLEASGDIGGSLDAAGDPENGYMMRGGRMIESRYVCTFDLLSSIPTLDKSRSVAQEIFAWNEMIPTMSRSRLFEDGHRVDAPEYGLSEKHLLGMERLAIEPEGMLGRSTISDHFDPSFFKTRFWQMWSTTFAFQPWHSAVELKRYLLRFVHMVSGFNRLGGIMRTVYNQYDSIVRPLRKWLEERGVVFRLNTRVTDIALCHDLEGYFAECVLCEQDGHRQEIWMKENELVIVTLGSMTDSSKFGSMDSAPVLHGKEQSPSWSLWEKLAHRSKYFGHPANFSDHVEQSKWVSFTTTLHTPEVFKLVRDLTGNVPGEGGLVSFPHSNWLASIVLPHQPHFIGQPANVNVLWGYGLSVEHEGNFVRKAMSSCTGREVMTEILGHLGLDTEANEVLKSCTCIPCMMPFITSQFLPRVKGDRPDVVPKGSRNLAFVGQFCELPEDVVFTVEYSIRSAQTAVYSLLGLKRTPPPVYKGAHDPRVLLGAFRTLHDVHESSFV